MPITTPTNTDVTNLNITPSNVDSSTINSLGSKSSPGDTSLPVTTPTNPFGTGSDAPGTINVAPTVNAKQPINVNTVDSGSNVNTNNYPINNPTDWNSIVQGALKSNTTGETTPNSEETQVEKDLGITNPSDLGVTGIASKINDLQAQIDSANTSAETGKLQLTQNAEGQGVSTAILNSQQAEVDRENAIKILPLTAELNAEQGRYLTANSMLDKIITAQHNDSVNNMNYQKDQLDYAEKYADSVQKIQLQAQSDALQEKMKNEEELFTAKQTAVASAIATGDYKTAGAISKATDLDSVGTILSGMGNGSNLVGVPTKDVPTMSLATNTLALLNKVQQEEANYNPATANQFNQDKDALNNSILALSKETDGNFATLGGLQIQAPGSFKNLFGGSNNYDNIKSLITTGMNAVAPNYTVPPLGQKFNSESDVQNYFKSTGKTDQYTNMFNSAQKEYTKQGGIGIMPKSYFLSIVNGKTK